MAFRAIGASFQLPQLVTHASLAVVDMGAGMDDKALLAEAFNCFLHPPNTKPRACYLRRQVAAETGWRAGIGEKDV